MVIGTGASNKFKIRGQKFEWIWKQKKARNKSSSQILKELSSDIKKTRTFGAVYL